jgi:hypothetical protein
MGESLGRLAMMAGRAGPPAPAGPQGPPTAEAEGPQEPTVNGALATQTCPKCGTTFPVQAEKGEGPAEDANAVRAWFEQNHPATQMARGAAVTPPGPPAQGMMR